MQIEVTVIVPVYREEKYIRRCVESIISQNFPHEKMEILLIDGGSADQTCRILDEYELQYPFIRVLNNKKRFVSNALNQGIKAAHGEVIIRMDAHTVYPPDYIPLCVKTLNELEADNVGGRIIPVPGTHSLIARAIPFALSHVFGVGNSKFRTENKPGYVDTVPFGAFKKSAFERTGLFNETLIRNQDIELNSRINASGGKVYLNPEIRAYYFNRPTLRELWQQSFNNGKWNIFTLIVNRNALSWRHFMPLLFITALLISAALSVFSGLSGVFFLTMLLIYFGASLLVSASIAASHGMKFLPVLPVVFATLHFSYGFGSMHGLMSVSRLHRKRLIELRIKSLRSMQTKSTQPKVNHAD